MGQDTCLRSIFLADMQREGSRELDACWRTEKQATETVQERGSRDPGRDYGSKGGNERQQARSGH